MWKVAITTTREAEEAVADLLHEIFGQPATGYTDFNQNTTTVAVYCQARPPKLTVKRAKLREGLGWIESCGLNLGAARLSVRKLPRQNWAESWKRHFKPIAIGDKLLIKPGWNKRRPRKGQTVIVLDPGLSFGTGHHPTTAFCLHELVRRRISGKPQAFLDLGTGSGILAIAAAKLGYSPIHAIDSDPESIRVARCNARRNCVLGRIQFARQDLARLRARGAQSCDLICANLVASLLVAERQRIARRLRPGGALVAAGILRTETKGVLRGFRALRLRLARSRTDREWWSATFLKANLRVTD